MDQVMNDTGMVWILFPEFFQNGRCLKLLGQTGVGRRGITDTEDRESVKGLHFEVVRIFIAEFPHCRFVRNDAFARPHWSMTRLANCTCARTLRRVVVNVERSDKSALPIRAGV